MAQHDMVLDNNPGLAFRQDLNNALAALVSASLGSTAPTNTYAGQEWVDTGTTIDTDGPWLRQRNSANTAWIRVRKVDIDQILLKVQQDQIAVTTAGTSPAFTISTKLTNSVAIAANQRFRVKFHATGTTGSNTLARDGLTAYNLKQYDSTGTKVSAVIVANMLTDVEYDGTDYVVLDPLPIPLDPLPIPSSGIGEVAYFAGTTPPSGWIKANGAALNRTVYAPLFSVIGTTYGAGDGTTTFNVPDLRGEFIRGLDDGRGVDPGRGIGTTQADMFRSHSHQIWGDTSADLTGRGRIPSVGNTGFDNWNLTENTGGTETRPRNVALLACIKYS
jgi:microcystin-dependent protein